VTLTLDPAAVDLALAALYLETTPGRQEELRRQADLVERWDGLVEALERHGVLGLFHRNARAAALPFPAGVGAALERRVVALQEDARRFGFTLERLVRALVTRGIRPTLLKGAALALDVYPEPHLRGQGDLDLLVEPGEVEAAVAAAQEAGLLCAPDSFPTWWYRRTHFHRKLAPSSALLREVELHWALHHPSLGPTPDASGLRARRESRGVPQGVDGRNALVLDPLDRLLHLATHLVSHARGAPGRADRATLSAVLTETDHPLRLKWVLDLVVELERHGASLPVDALEARAREWNAAGELAWTIQWVRAALTLLPEADAAAARLLAALEGAPRPREVGVRPAGGGPSTALDFRLDALGRLCGWLWPADEVLERRRGASGPLARARQVTAVLTHVLGAALLLPAAAVGRALLAPGRRRAFTAAAAPEAVLDLAVAWRRRAA
jgi:hypothetical protein